MSFEPLPAAAEAEHLTLALRRAGVLGDNAVRSVVAESPRNQILSQITLLRLTYRSECDAPGSLILKTGHPERAGMGSDAGHHEVEFYNGVAARMPGRLVPRCFEASWSPETGTWHLLLEDLTDSHAIATQWPLPPAHAQCETIMRVRAKFHAMWWNDKRLGIAIGNAPDDEEIARRAQRLAGQFAGFADAMGDRLPGERIKLFERWLGAAPSLLKRAAGGPHRTVVHGDAHVWNCFMPREEGSGDVRLFDWDSWRIGTGAIDLAYMMAVHWHPEMRREREGPLLDGYHAALLEHGVSSYDRAALDEDYRRSVLWHAMTPVMQQAYGIPPVIWWNNLERVMLAMDDLDCRDFLP